LVSLGRVNARLLTRRCIDPLRRKFPGNYHGHCEEQTSEDIFENSLDTALINYI
jgi:hypothetical protein